MLCLTVRSGMWHLHAPVFYFLLFLMFSFSAHFQSTHPKTDSLFFRIHISRCDILSIILIFLKNEPFFRLFDALFFFSSLLDDYFLHILWSFLFCVIFLIYVCIVWLVSIFSFVFLFSISVRWKRFSIPALILLVLEVME